MFIYVGMFLFLFWTCGPMGRMDATRAVTNSDPQSINEYLYSQNFYFIWKLNKQTNKKRPCTKHFLPSHSKIITFYYWRTCWQPVWSDVPYFNLRQQRRGERVSGSLRSVTGSWLVIDIHSGSLEKRLHSNLKWGEKKLQNCSWTRRVTSTQNWILPSPLPPSLPLSLSMSAVIILTAADKSAESSAADAPVTVWFR